MWLRRKILALSSPEKLAEKLEDEIHALHRKHGRNTDRLQDIIAAGAPLKDPGNTCLTEVLTMYENRLDVFTLLLESGASPHQKMSKTGMPVICFATGEYNRPFVKQLLAFGADPNAQDQTGYTPLFNAVLANDTEGAHMLRDAGADINKKNNHGQTAIFAAARCGNTKMLMLLAGMHAHMNVTDNTGRTVLNAALQYGQTHVVDYLLQAGILKLPGMKKTAENCLQAAALNNTPALKMLISAGVDVNGANESGCTPLHAAILKPSLVKWLIDKGADIEARDIRGHTPLFECAENGEKVSAKILLGAGADLFALSKEGLTPRQHAENLGNTAIAKFLAQEELKIRQKKNASKRNIFEKMASPLKTSTMTPPMPALTKTPFPTPQKKG